MPDTQTQLRIRSLDSLARGELASVGAKAAALGELLYGGFRVPHGFVLTNVAYAEFIAPLRSRILDYVTDDLIADPAEIESGAAEIRGWIQAQPLPPLLQSDLDAALAALNATNHPSYAARTSTQSDDLATSFGSGVARAYLGLASPAEVAAAAARCWAALWNSRSMYYRHRKKIVQTDVALAVLVQPMVRADCAGVMFTQDPMSGAGDEIQIRSIWGLGAPLTSARLRADEFRVDRFTTAIRDRTIVEQVVKLMVSADGHTEEQSIPANQTETPSLTEDQVKELADLGKKIESFFGAPQDIEWAIADDEIFVLQARPVGIRAS